MKKQLRKIMCLMMVLVMCLSIQTPTFAAKSAKYIAAEKTYINYMSKKVGYFSIRDLDGNGIPELIMTLTNTKASYVYTYNYSTKKMVRITSLSLGNGNVKSNRALFSASKHMVAFYNRGSNSDQYRFYRIKGSKATLVYTYKSIHTGSSAGYYLNGRRYSYSSMKSSLNNQMKTFKYLEYAA